MLILPEEVENFRDKKWRREETLKIERREQLEAFVEDLGFCLALTDSRTNLPSVYVAVCGRRDAHSPKNVQKDYEMSLAWTLKDEVMMRVGNGSKVDVIAVGTLPLHLPSGLVLYLNNCYLVPALSMNIISGSCLLRDGYLFKS